ncbi:hypothetical protein [Halostagnicola bangensis]
MTIESRRQKDILLMLFAVQFSLLVLVLAAWMWPLLLFPLLLTFHVMKSEYSRRLEEDHDRAEADPADD